MQVKDSALIMSSASMTPVASFWGMGLDEWARAIDPAATADSTGLVMAEEIEGMTLAERRRFWADKLGAEAAQVHAAAAEAKQKETEKTAALRALRLAKEAADKAEGPKLKERRTR